MHSDISSLDSRTLGAASRAPAWAKGQRPVLLYGAGNFGRDVVAALAEQRIKPSSFLDGKIAQPAERHGLTVYPLAHPQVETYRAEKPIVLITVFNHLTDWAELVETLHENGFPDVITPLEYFDFLADNLGPRYWLTRRSYYAERWPALLEAAALYDDPVSREIYSRVLWFRVGHDLAAHPEPQLKNQYAPLDLPRWKEPLRFLDGGACVGEAVQTLMRLGYRIDQLHAWEPDLANLTKLNEYLDRECPQLASAIYPCGLWSKTTALSFESDSGTASAIRDTGHHRIIVLDADHALRNQAVNLVKLDIEGAEAEALLGMRSLIERNRPGLAVCVYHKPDDMITIPTLLKSWNLGYRFHLRTHCWNTFDTVLYALPE